LWVEGCRFQALAASLVDFGLADVYVLLIMSPILKLEKDDSEKELEFELDYQLSLTTQQRFEMMFRKSREIAQMLIDNGHRKPSEIIKRK